MLCLTVVYCHMLLTAPLVPVPRTPAVNTPVNATSVQSTALNIQHGGHESAISQKPADDTALSPSSLPPIRMPLIGAASRKSIPVATRI